MHPLRVLLNVVPVLLVEPGRVPRSGDAHASVPLDCRLTSQCSCTWKEVQADVLSQDAYGAERKEKIQNEMSLYRCHTIFNCKYYPAFPFSRLALIGLRFPDLSEGPQPCCSYRQDET